MYKRTINDKLFDTFNYSLLILLSLSVLYPFYYIVINSINPLFVLRPEFIFPKQTNLMNYKIIFRDNQIINAFIMSVSRTVLGMAITVFNCAMCAFALRKKDVRFRKFYLALFVGTMFFDGGLIPRYLNFKNLGLINNFLVYIIPAAYAFFYIIVFMTYFNDIPDALEESAKIDGANSFYIFIKIYFPISMPVIATIGLFAGVAQWNSWFDTLYFTSSRRLMTMSGLLLRIIKEAGAAYQLEMLKDREFALNPEGVKFATMVVTVAPILFIYPFLQRYFVKGIMIGSIKG